MIHEENGDATVSAFVTDLPIGVSDRPVLKGCCVVVCTRNRPATVARFLDSVFTQDAIPEELLVVDGSDAADTEQSVRDLAQSRALAVRTRYVRVGATQRGLTRQRNLALRMVSLRLIAFFDDDIVLRPDCLAQLANAHTVLGDSVAGVGAFIDNERLAPPPLWRIRRLTGIVSTLRPGRYCRSGISTPWGFLTPTNDTVSGDWLPGGATMWRTDLARAVGFEEGFAGYGSGEDLDFSLRIGRFGRLVMAGSARVYHFKADGGRPDGYQMGYLGLRNHYHTHRYSMPNRRALDAVWFAYAFIADTAIRSVGVLRPLFRQWTWDFLRGRTRFFVELAAGRLPLLPRANGEREVARGG